jgi:hypothetical protein
MIEVDQNERIILTGNEAHSVAASRMIRLNAFVKAVPRLRVCAAGGVAVGLNWDFGPLIFASLVVPADKLSVGL